MHLEDNGSPIDESYGHRLYRNSTRYELATSFRESAARLIRFESRYETSRVKIQQHHHHSSGLRSIV